jgi:hypothetical protein
VADLLVRQSKAEARENGKLKRAAELIAFFGRIEQATAEKGLALVWPFIPPLVCELLTIVFLHLAFAVPVPRRLATATLSGTGSPESLPATFSGKDFQAAKVAASRQATTLRLCSQRSGISAGPPATPSSRPSWAVARGKRRSGRRRAAAPSSKSGTGARCASRYRSACTEQLPRLPQGGRVFPCRIDRAVFIGVGGKDRPIAEGGFCTRQATRSGRPTGRQ